MQTTYRKMISEALAEHGESWEDVVCLVVGKADEFARMGWPKELQGVSGEAQLDVPIDSGYGSVEGPPFHLWTTNRIYFQCGYDGSEWVSSVPRHPSGEQPATQGGG